MYRAKQISKKVYNNSLKFNIRMSTIFMKSKNSKTYDAYRLRLNLTGKMDLSRGDKHAAIITVYNEMFS